MSIELRRTETVLAVIEELIAAGKSTIRPGDVNGALRERGAPMGTWEVRAEFSRLEALGRIECEEDTGDWRLLDGTPLQDASSAN